MAFIKKHKKLVALLLVVAIAAGTLAAWFTSTKLVASADGPLYGSSELAPEEDRKFLEDENAPEGMKLAATKGQFSLFVDETYATFAILDGNTGKMWYSNPPEVFNAEGSENPEEGETPENETPEEGADTDTEVKEENSEDKDSKEETDTKEEVKDETPEEGETTEEGEITEDGEVSEGENPEEGETDEESNVNELVIGSHGDIPNRMKSQITFEYYDSKQTLKMMNSFFQSIEEENFTIKPIKDGFRTSYTIGKIRYRKEMIPRVMVTERFEQFRALVTTKEYADEIDKRYAKITLSKLPGVQQKLYSLDYPNLDPNTEYYVLNPSAPDFAFERIYKGFFGEAGYTNADLEQDDASANLETVKFDLEQVTLHLEITLTEDGFKANMPLGAAIIPETLYIKEIYMLEFFGCAGIEDKGYMFMPDGSGTIVNLNNGKIDVSASAVYGVSLYGDDTAIKKSENIGKTIVGTMPIFAMSVNNDGFWTVIENGDAYTNIISQTAGNVTNYNRIYASVAVQPVDKMIISSAGNDDKEIFRYQQKPYAGNITLAYNFLATGETDYDDVAIAYRNYLIAKGELPETTYAGTSMPFLVELVGNTDVDKSIAGIHYDSTETLTTFEEANIIMNLLKEKGIKAPTVKYSSWFDSSQYTMTDSAGFASGMGGEDGFNSFKANVEAMGGSLYMNTSVQNVRLGLGKFNNILYGVRHTYNEIVGLRDFHPAQIIRDKEAEKYYLLSTRYTKDYLNGIYNRVGELGGNSVWLEDYANQLYSDFSKNENIVRPESQRLLREAIEAASKGYKTAFDSPYSYMFKYVSFAGEIPTTSSGHQLADATVPFYSIVISGHIPATGQIVNLAGNAQDEMLKAVETGTGLTFKWIYEQNSALREMDGDELEKIYSLNYAQWIDSAADFYNKASADLADIWGKPIVGHKILSNNVNQTEFAVDKTTVVKVIVNYNDTAVTVGDVTIEANDYVVIR